MKEVVKQREEPQQSNLLKWEEKWEEKLASVVPLLGHSFSLLYYEGLSLIAWNKPLF